MDGQHIYSKYKNLDYMNPVGETTNGTWVIKTGANNRGTSAYKVFGKYIHATLPGGGAYGSRPCAFYDSSTGLKVPLTSVPDNGCFSEKLTSPDKATVISTGNDGVISGTPDAPPGILSIAEDKFSRSPRTSISRQNTLETTAMFSGPVPTSSHRSTS